MAIRLRFFASLREALGPGEELAVEPGLTLGRLRVQLAARGGAYAQRLGEGRAVRGAVDQVMADDATPVPDGAEVAFFPPVTGG
ncbi:MAG: MoaD/ThiS family protein [Rubrivivax sp.]